VNEEFLYPEFPNLKRPDPGVPEKRSYPTSRFPVRFIQFHQVVKTYGQTDIYYISAETWGGVGGGIKVCAISTFIYSGNFFGRRGVIWLFFLWKRIKGRKGYFYKIC